MQTTKYCYKCNTNKTINKFTKLKSSEDGLQPMCTVCRKAYKTEYRRSLMGLPSEILLHQKSASKHRGHDKPKYNMKELRIWLMAQDKYKTLHMEWVESGYDILLAPSVDRIDITQGYTISNIQLMTWNENKAKGHVERLTDRRICYEVKQLSKSGVLLNIFPSMRNASRETGVSNDCIQGCVAGKFKQAGGFLWERVQR